MPPRRRRDGYRPALLSQQLQDAITAEAARLEAVPGPVETVAAVGEFYAALDDALDEVALARLRAVAELRARGWSYARIADATGLSKGRVAQLTRAAAERDL
ncbi:hypothetical protein KLP28_08615 [Nocardioidaceae bacterium]|nr:hypothetical protein KLP28_08615 [Nocardioidaceae bacterium]